MSKYDDLESRVAALEKIIDTLIPRINDIDRHTVRVLGTPTFTEGAQTWNETEWQEAVNKAKEQQNGRRHLE